MGRIFVYFFKGIIFTVPISITLYIIYSIVVKIGSLFKLLGLTVHPAVDPLIGFAAVVGLIIVIGYLGSSIFKPLFVLFDHYLEKAPLIKTIYSSIKDLLSAFVGEKKRFNKPVLVNMGNNLEKFGFITNESLVDMNISEDKVAVYFPHSYAFSGNLYIVSKKFVTPLNENASEMMKFIVSGGVTHVE
jgi:uncharacterized membrane protein